MARRQRRYEGSLRVVDYSDLEVLHVLDDNAGDDGFTDVIAIVEALDVSERSASARMAWMRKYETVERDGNKARWRPTQLGDSILRGTLPSSMVSGLEGISEGSLVLVTRALRERSGTGPMNVLLRREWRYQDWRNR